MFGQGGDSPVWNLGKDGPLDSLLASESCYHIQDDPNRDTVQQQGEILSEGESKIVY